MTGQTRDVTGEAVSDAALRCFVGYNLKRAINALQADLARTLEPFGLRLITFSALALIVDNPGLRPSQLAKALSVERANVVVYVGQLEDAGWVRRSQSATDRRAHALHGTVDGRRVYDCAQRAVQAHDKRMLDGMQPVEISALNKALAAIEARAAI